MVMMFPIVSSMVNQLVCVVDSPTQALGWHYRSPCWRKFYLAYATNQDERV